MTADRFSKAISGSIENLGASLRAAGQSAGEFSLASDLVKTEANAEISRRQIAGIAVIAISSIVIYMVLR